MGGGPRRESEGKPRPAAWQASAGLEEIPHAFAIPGMDPYLESPEIFPDFHDSLITYLRENLQANLPPPYFAAIGRRVWIAASRRSIGPDVLHDEFREPFLEVYTDSAEGKRLVTSVEVLSLSNKTPGEHGRELFLRKQKELLASRVNLVEIDLLRGGEHTTAVPLESALASCGGFDYHVSVHLFDDFESFFVYQSRWKNHCPRSTFPSFRATPPSRSISRPSSPLLRRRAVCTRINYVQDPITPPLPLTRLRGRHASSRADEASL